MPSRANRLYTGALTGAGVVLLLALAACSGAATPTPKPTETAAGPVLLTFAVYGPPQVITAYTKIASGFSASHPGVTVNIQPYSSAVEFRKDLKSIEDNTDATTPDLFMADEADVPALVAGKAVSPVDQMLVKRDVDFGDGFQREALEDFSADSALQCMPVDSSPLVVYFNTDLVDPSTLTRPGEAVIDSKNPWTMAQFAAAARSASHAGVRGVYVAPKLEQIAPFVWSGNGHVVDDVDKPTRLTLADSSSADPMEQLLELVRDPSVTFNQRQIERVSALDRFKTGKLAMILGTREITPALRAIPGLRFDVLPMPRLKRTATSGTVRGICISSAGSNHEDAADFLAYAVSDESTDLLADTGYVVPTNVDVANSSSFLQPDLAPASADVFTRASRYIQGLPAVDAWPEVEDATRPLLAHLFYDPVIDPLADRLQAIDDATVPIFTPGAVATPSATPTP